MKKLFWLGLLGLFLFEIANVYLIMPMPGSQEMNSIDVAYILYKWRWVFRIVFALMMVVGLLRSPWKRAWLLLIPLLIVAAVIYIANFKMAADHMFYQPKQLLMVDASQNKVGGGRLVLGIDLNGEAKAYPIQFIGYHHQVRDTVGGEAVMITYCTVCRTGRVYEPIVNGKPERFRLVGMDHFNAMFEDETTGSWWRQVTGEAIAGKLKGSRLPEVPSTQTSLEAWLRLHPSSKVMQADPAFANTYDSTMKYESGFSRNALTGTDSISWRKKSWVIGVKWGDERKAFDWNELKKKRVMHDAIGGKPVLLVLGDDDKTFFAFEKPQAMLPVTLRGDTIVVDGHHFRIDGVGIDTSYTMKRLPAYQEFWHSWRSFNLR